MKNLWISVRITLAMCVVLTVGYVLLLRLTSAVVSPNDGEAALVELDGKVVGAANVGQAFTDSVYFWGRPSAVEYNGGGSGGGRQRARTIRSTFRRWKAVSNRSWRLILYLSKGGRSL